MSAPDISNFPVTPEIVSRIAEIDEFKGAWRALGRLAPERLAALKRVATVESVASSTRIEGAKLSDREVERLLSRLGIQSLASRDEQEVAGYAEVMETVFSRWDAIPPTENHIKQLHRDLLRYSTKDERHRGEYKTLPNDVLAFDRDGQVVGTVFETSSPMETPGRMRDLVAWLRSTLAGGEIHPLIVIGVFTVVFLAVHPFQDGNGRLSRILTTLLLLRAGYAYVPYSSLETIIEGTKEDYYRALRSTQRTIDSEEPNWGPWLTYYLGALAEQKSRLERKIERERLLVDVPQLSLQILDLCREHGRVTVGEIARATGVSRNTIKGHVANLVRQGQLARHGAGRGTWYSLS